MKEKILEILKKERSYTTTDAYLISPTDVAFEIETLIKRNLREELIEYDKWLYSGVKSEPMTARETVDEYLKQR